MLKISLYQDVLVLLCKHIKTWSYRTVQSSTTAKARASAIGRMFSPRQETRVGQIPQMGTLKE